MAENMLAAVKSIIAVHSAKGGVGKSTITVNLAASLARKGARVGLLDADIHGPSATVMLGNGEWPDPGKDENTIHPLEAHGVKFISMGNLVTKETPLIWRGAMVHSVLSQFLNNVLWGELDYLFIDMPPGTGDALISLGQAVPLSGVVCLSTPQELSMVDTIRGIRAFSRMNVPVLGIIENMSWFICDDCGERAHLFGTSGVEIMADEMGIPLLGRVPLEPSVCEDSDRGIPFILRHPDSASARAIDHVIDHLLSRLEGKLPAASLSLKWQEMDWQSRTPQPPADILTTDGPLAAIWQVSQDELGLKWADGEVSLLSIRALRQACPCAACVDEWTGRPILKPESLPADISLKEIKSVGRYALNPVFSDGHQSGLFHFDRLRSLVTA